MKINALILAFAVAFSLCAGDRTPAPTNNPSRKASRKTDRPVYCSECFAKMREQA